MIVGSVLLWLRPAAAQVEDAGVAINVGDRIRVMAPSVALEHFVGTVLKLDADSLWIDSEERGLLTIPLRALVALEVSRGKKKNALTGLGIGVLGGATAGWLILSSGHNDIDPRPFGAIIGGAAGGLVGLIIGANTQPDRWEPVPLAER